MLESVAGFKLFSAALIWILAIAGGIVPLMLRGQHHGKGSLTSVLNMFAGGIFLSGAVLHLLPDAQENEALSTWLCESEDECFKWANFFFGTGFLFVLILELFAHSLQRTFGDENSKVGLQQKHDHELTSLVVNSTIDHSHHHQPDVLPTHHHHHHASSSSDETEIASPSARIHPDETDLVVGHEHYNHDLESGGHSHSLSYVAPSYGSTLKDSTTKHALHQQQHHHGSKAMDTDDDALCADMEVTHAHIHGIMDAKPVLAFVVFVALSFHSLMEGMGIGASNHAAWDILIAVLAHKSLAAFALTLELQHHQVPFHRVATSIGIFSVMSPLGIFLGSLLVDSTEESIGSGICSALAGGTFLFVAVMEVIPQEFQNNKHLSQKCAALVAGYCSMGVLSIWA
uniref:Zinc/iron permease n=1 Tax=Globisporangium ultimum (strain ATCC 200006 / CBS 805.95 / DAOM BR144) TaxID=431595 RepID=K3X4C2_GLOUD